MQTLKPIFTEKEQHVGYIETDSGTLLFTDGIWGTAIPTVDQTSMILDVETERTKFPVYTIMRGGRRFLMIALDTNVINTPITNDNDRVEVDDPLSEDELAEGEDPA